MNAETGKDMRASQGGHTLEETSESYTGIVFSTRIRLARNLRGVAFPGWAGQRERRRVFQQLADRLIELPALNHPRILRVEDMDGVERDVLVEQHLISPDLAHAGAGAGLVHDPVSGMSAMINEEDHLRLQILRQGSDLPGAWQWLDRLDSALEPHLDYAFSKELGYLTACPSNVGTGMRASVMLHLPGLRMAGEIEAVIRGLNRTGFAVRGVFGEGSECAGALFQVSNQITLGRREIELIRQLDDMVRTVSLQERQARRRLREWPEPRLEDPVARLVGLSRYARLLNTAEAMDLLSGLWLGWDTGLLTGEFPGDLPALMRRIQPGHLQREAQRPLTTAVARDAFRADYLRTLLTKLELTRET